MTASTAATTELRPFRAAVPDTEIDDLRHRLARTRWPRPETVDDWSQGVRTQNARELVAYWEREYDWRRFESALNALPQVVTTIDGLDVHAVHVRSANPGALPLLLTHGLRELRTGLRNLRARAGADSARPGYCPGVTAPILVTGATGTVGAEVVAELARRGRAVRAASRRPDVAPGPHDPVERVAFDFGRLATFAAALAGVEVAFLVRPPALGRLSDLAPLLDAAVAAGVRHVVLLSVQGADRVPVLPHARVERWLRGSTTAWTFLRPSFFDQNLTSVHARAIRELDEVVVPAGRGRTAFVDAVDVALAAAGILVDPAAHAGRAYTLTGSEALTYAEVAALLTEVCGRPVRYRAPGLLRYLVRARSELDLPPALVAATSVVYTTARLGLAANRTDDLARLLGRAPTTLRTFLERERASFLP